MMAKLHGILLLLVLLFVQNASPAVGGEKSPNDDRIAALRKQIAARRAKADVKGLQQLGEEIKAEWQTQKDPAYHRVILELCAAISSTRTTETGVNELVRDLAVAAIDSGGDKHAPIMADLLLFLEGDLEYSTGQLQGEDWIKERRIRAERWLKVCKSIREQNAALPKPTELASISVEAPEGLRNNVDPSAVKDPILRKKYAEALAKNAQLADAHNNKHYFELTDRSVAQRSLRYLTEAYSKPPFRTDELAKLLETYQFPKAKRQATIEDVRTREAAKIERDAKLAKLVAALGKAATPMKLQFSLDGAAFRDATVPLYVMQGSTVTFKAPSTGESWVWQGSSGASGKGATTKVTFSKLSKEITDLKTVTASDDGNTITAHVIVYDLLPIYTPEDNFAGRDLDNYGVGEIIYLSYKTAPAGISESDLGGLRWLIERGGGDLFASAGGIGSYQVSFKGGSFVLAIQVVARPTNGKK